MIYGMLDTTIGKEKQKQHVRKVKDFHKCNQEELIDSLTGMLLGGNREYVLEVFNQTGPMVPQGSILGPLLFTIFVNDLPNTIQKCRIKQYADDTTVTCVADDHTALEMMMESDMQRISQWADKNGLKLNIKKTQLLLLGRRRGQTELAEV